MEIFSEDKSMKWKAELADLELNEFHFHMFQNFITQQNMPLNDRKLFKFNKLLSGTRSDPDFFTWLCVCILEVGW